jgi:asparagine synthase (glutamine-hydrolysing)
MGYIAAVVGRKEQDVTSHLKKMLNAKGGSTPSYFGISSPDTGEFFNKFFEHIPIMGSSLIAYKSSNNVTFPQQPLQQKSGSLVFDGLLFNTFEPDPIHVSDLLKDGVSEGMWKMVSEVRGVFSAAAINDSKIFLAKDVVGTVPLYYGENEEVHAAASNMKSLMAIGLEPTPVIPGSLVELSKKGYRTTEVKKFTQPQQSSLSESQCMESLHRLLGEVSEDIVRKIRGGAVAFSGGIDSTLVTHYLKEVGGDLSLICVGVGDQREYREAQRAADAMNLDVIIHPITHNELENNLDDILLSVEDPNPMKIGIATPLYFATQQAVENGHTTIFSGNCSDELFGGYYKYMTQWLTEGEKVQESMYGDVVNSWKENFDRDAKICKDLDTRLLLPFADTRIIEFGLGVPVKYKLPSNIEEPRKIILRRLAKKLGFSKEIINRPKKAVQYSTGVQKTLNKIAKKRGESLHEYFKKRYEELFSDRL